MKSQKINEVGRFSIGVPIAVALLVVSGNANASGWPPFAIDDAAAVKRGGTVSILANGRSSVLANDIDLEGDSLTAVLERPPKHGKLEFFEDGTFIYRHDGGGNDRDQFRYRAFDGSSLSRRAEVRIDILPGDPIAPVIIGQREVNVDEDKAVEIELKDLVVEDPDNDYPRDFTLEVGDGENYTRSGVTITPFANFNGTLSVPVRVSDGFAFSNVFNLRVDVRSVNDPPNVVGNIEDQEALEGLLFSLAVAGNFEDIDAGDVLRYSASGLPRSGTLRMDAQSGILRGTPVRTDARENPYTVQVRATDSGGASAILTFELTVFANNRADLAVAASVSKNPTLVGESSQWNIRVENLGPASLDDGELVSNWTTAGPTLDLAPPPGCSVESNNSPQPVIRCPLPPLTAGQIFVIEVEGTQGDDGDNTLRAAAIADDPVNENNATRISAQVAAAFSDGAAQKINGPATAIVVDDFDADGLLDLAATGDQLVLHMNTGERRFANAGRAIGSGGVHLVSLDWNSDGARDLATASRDSRSARIYTGDGTGAFRSPVDISLQDRGDVTTIVAGDFNSDGFDDLVFAGSFGIQYARNRGNGDARVESVSRSATLDLAALDFTRDGFTDLVAVNSGDGSLQLWRGIGDGRFNNAGTFDAGPATRVTATDFDADGSSDLLLAIDGNELAAPYTQLLRGRGGSFEFYARLGASAANDLVAGDINDDGFTDVIVVNDAGVHQLYTGSPSGSFALSAEQIISSGMQHGVVVDFNVDESMDLIIAGVKAGLVEVHANDGLGRLGPGDIEPPELLLAGESVMSIPAGSEFVDPGATAIDNIDGDLTDAIVVFGTVDPNVVGTYSLSYSVEDRATNLSRATRTVQVGVNAGSGGSGGGAFSVPMLFFLVVLLVVRACRITRRTCGLRL